MHALITRLEVAVDRLEEVTGDRTEREGGR